MAWSSGLAYAVGLIASDGCLSKDGRHIDFTSKDIEQIRTFAKILGLKNKIGLKSRGLEQEKKYFRIQFGNVSFYRFLLRIGLTPRKSLTMKKLLIPNKYFRDFLRGVFDGDGYTSSFWDSIWKSSFRLHLGFVSGSRQYLYWIKKQISKLYGIDGTLLSGAGAYTLRFYKWDSVALLNKMYYSHDIFCLERKRSKIMDSLGIICRQAQVV